MFATRVIPCLLLKDERLVKTVRFKKASYIGDPLNAARIFSQKGVDELVFLDIQASLEQVGPRFDLLKNIAAECFIPFAYGGRLHTMEDLKKLFLLGAEKAIINSQALKTPNFISKAAQEYGSQSIVVSMDIRKNFLGKYRVYAQGGRRQTPWHPVDYARDMEIRGAGEILLTSISQDGTWDGYDLGLVKLVSEAIGIPVVACGGAGCVEDCMKAVRAGASAAAAGSLFIYKAKGQGVLLNFPEQHFLKILFESISCDRGSCKE